MTETNKKHLIDVKMIERLTQAKASTVKLWLSELTEVEPGKYDAREFYVWYRDKIYRPKMAETTVLDDEGEEMHLDIQAYKIQYEMARAEKYDIRRKSMLEQYVSDDETRSAFHEVAHVIDELMMDMPDRIAEISHEKEEAKMLNELDIYIRGLLIEYSSK